jgi:hypothetical protein
MDISQAVRIIDTAEEDLVVAHRAIRKAVGQDSFPQHIEQDILRIINELRVTTLHKTTLGYVAIISNDEPWHRCVLRVSSYIQVVLHQERNNNPRYTLLADQKGNSILLRISQEKELVTLIFNDCPKEHGKLQFRAFEEAGDAFNWLRSIKPDDPVICDLEIRSPDIILDWL